MNLFAIIAAMMAVVLLVAGAQRPRLAVILAAILWLLYAVLRTSGGDRRPVRCGLQHSRRSCVLHSYIGAPTYWAYQSYMGRSGHQKVVGMVLGVIGLFVLGLLAEGHRYKTLAQRRFCGGYSGDRPLCDQIEVHDQSDMTTRVKSGTPLHPQILR